MNSTRQIFAVAALAAASVFSAGAAFAQEATPDTWLQTAQSGKTRAQVSAELDAARKSGLTRAWSNGYMEPVRSQALRAEVRAKTQLAIQSGEQRTINAEVYSFTAPAAQTVAGK